MKSIKYIVTSAILTITLSLTAQTNMDIIKTSITEEAKFLQDGTYVDKKINIVETRKQLVDTKESQSHLLNQERAKTPIKVSKTIRIDNDKDRSYDLATVVTYEIINDEIKNLKVMNVDNSMVTKDEILLSGEKQEAYLLGGEGLAVFGYINEDNEFELNYF